MTILVIDDDEGCRDVVCEVLFEEGYLAASAKDGNQALGMLLSGLRPDLILCDLRKAGMNGYEFREHQLAIPAIAEIPFVISTATRDRCEVPCDAQLSKPFRIDDLIATINRLCSSDYAVSA